MNKSYILLLVVLIIIAGAIIWMQPSSAPTTEREIKTEEVKEPENGARKFLNRIKTDTALNFSDIEDIELSWTVKTQEEIKNPIFQGRKIEIKGVLKETEEQINSYFKNIGFDISEDNAATGSISWATGYQKDNLICAVAVGLWLDENELPFKTGERDVAIACAIVEDTGENGDIEY